MNSIFKRCASLVILILLMAGLFTAIAPALAEAVEPEAPAAPTSVQLDYTGTVKVPLGETLTLTPTLSPENAATTYTWKSSKRRVASVSGGVVKAKKAGTATITVTTANKKKAKVRVKVYDPYKPTSVKLDYSGTVRLPLGEKLTLTPTLSPATARSGLKWKSSKKKVASVSGGVVKAKKAGTTTITVTTRNKKKARVKVKVYDPYKPTSVKLDVSGTQTLMAANALQLTATLYPETARSGLKWKSSKKRVATVDANGVVYGIKPGKTTITVTARNNKKAKAKIKIKVIDDGNQPIVAPPGYNLPYLIYACKNTHTIAILARDENGEWTRVLRKFSTGTGVNNSTDVGFFFLTKKERWHKWGSGYSPFSNKLSVGIYLHGPICKSKNQNTVRRTYYNHIGTDTSSGCLRTTTACSSWVYYNCPVGTEVIIAQNGRFSEPRPPKMKKGQTKDPTDPGTNFEILVTSFSVEPSSVSLTAGGTQVLTAYNIAPSSNSTGGRFTYVSDNNDVATVSASGVVTAVGPGSANIIMTADDDFKATVVIPVTVDYDSGAMESGAAYMASAEAFEADAPAAVEEDEAVDDVPVEETAVELVTADEPSPAVETDEALVAGTDAVPESEAANPDDAFWVSDEVIPEPETQDAVIEE